jgi:hypothetical protein
VRVTLLLVLLAACFDSEQMLERDEQEGPPVEPNPQGDFAAFVACLSYDDFVASNMAGAWSQVTSDAGSCTSCHNADGMFSGDARRFFDDLKSRTYVQIQFFTFDRAQQIVDVNTETIPRIGKSIAPYADHPRFNANKGIDATYDLHERTINRLVSGTCL